MTPPLDATTIAMNRAYQLAQQASKEAIQSIQDIRSSFPPTPRPIINKQPRPVPPPPLVYTSLLKELSTPPIAIPATPPKETPPLSPVPTFRSVSPPPPAYKPFLTIDDLYARYAPLNKLRKQSVPRVLPTMSIQDLYIRFQGKSKSQEQANKSKEPAKTTAVMNKSKSRGSISGLNGFSAALRNSIQTRKHRQSTPFASKSYSGLPRNQASHGPPMRQHLRPPARNNIKPFSYNCLGRWLT